MVLLSIQENIRAEPDWQALRTLDEGTAVARRKTEQDFLLFSHLTQTTRAQIARFRRQADLPGARAPMEQNQEALGAMSEELEYLEGSMQERQRTWLAVLNALRLQRGADPYEPVPPGMK